jgi:hypothetical protein
MSKETKQLATDFDKLFALLQVDFSENYTCMFQDEIQSAHWKQDQVSLFTAALWFDGKLHPTVIAFDDLNHGKEMAVSYIDHHLDTLPATVKPFPYGLMVLSRNLRIGFLLQPFRRFKRNTRLTSSGIILLLHMAKIQLMVLEVL